MFSLKIGSRFLVCLELGIGSWSVSGWQPSVGLSRVGKPSLVQSQDGQPPLGLSRVGNRLLVSLGAGNCLLFCLEVGDRLVGLEMGNYLLVCLEVPLLIWEIER